MNVSARLKKSVAGFLLAGAMISSATPAFAWWESGYAYRTRIDLNTSAAGVTGDLSQTPVLIRLHSGNFSFKDVKADGSDIRFVAGDDRTPLKFHIEKWSPQEQQALVWVDVAGLKAGAASAIYVYYGNKDARQGQDVAGTFGPDYRLVYHFNNDGAPADATANGLNAEGAAARNANGLIGSSLVLDGTTAVSIPAGAFAGGNESVSFWVSAKGDGTILAAPGSFSLVAQGGSLFLDINGQRSAGAPLPAGTWANVAIASDGAKTTLYVNGQPAGEVAAPLAQATGPVLLGQGFAGEVDEFRVAGTALPQSAFALAANSEGQSPKLASFGKGEQIGSGGNKFFQLVGALTFDAWVVIALLTIMLVIAIWVMITKYLAISRVSAANEEFAEAFEKGIAGRPEHGGLPDIAAGANAAGSSLAHIYEIAKEQLAKRIAEGRRGGARQGLRSQSVIAIRTAMDAGQVRVKQRLDTGMVILTLAISGGPFIGLAGTALGVMNTFNDVAAAGDVNINAIAPGMAAALLATVAGLIVAIPSLFAYNLLRNRAKEIIADNQIFADEVEALIAEYWQGADSPTPPARAAA